MELTGIDYSEGAVELAKKTAEAEQKEHPTKLPTINFHVRLNSVKSWKVSFFKVLTLRSGSKLRNFMGNCYI